MPFASGTSDYFMAYVLVQVSPPAANFQVNASALTASLTTATSSGDPTAVMAAVRSLAASTAAAAPPPTVTSGVTTIATVDVRLGSCAK